MALSTSSKTVDASTADTSADTSAALSIMPNLETYIAQEMTDAIPALSAVPTSEFRAAQQETGASAQPTCLATSDIYVLQPEADATCAGPATVAGSEAFTGDQTTASQPKPSITESMFTQRQKHCQFSSAQREAMCTHVSSGKSFRTVAGLFKTSASTVHAIFKRWSTQRSIESKTRSGRPCKLTDEQKQQLAILIDSHPKPTYAQLVECMGGTVSKRTIRRAIVDQQKDLAAADEARQ
ncbi:hypothetical protein CDD82_3384 [Ophiocordyceps australis]|uniref:Transposase Tc1-like domain-containing protein n=1 Tax=Ophiocordyceps australis TaxID=1399860 RepID=A0A2C5ZE61_9HYPO|nr:hypothetical protein CDD82_3384 [Ophiocordyceps australis]